MQRLRHLANRSPAFCHQLCPSSTFPIAYVYTTAIQRDKRANWDWDVFCLRYFERTNGLRLSSQQVIVDPTTDRCISVGTPPRQRPCTILCSPSILSLWHPFSLSLLSLSLSLSLSLDLNRYQVALAAVTRETWCSRSAIGTGRSPKTGPTTCCHCSSCENEVLLHSLQSIMRIIE